MATTAMDPSASMVTELRPRADCSYDYYYSFTQCDDLRAFDDYATQAGVCYSQYDFYDYDYNPYDDYDEETTNDYLDCVCPSYMEWMSSYSACAQTAAGGRYADCVDGWIFDYYDDYVCTDYDYTPAGADARTTRTSVPSPSLVRASTTPVTRIPTISHSPIPSYSSSASLLKGYCSTLEFALMKDGGAGTAYWAPALGCNAKKPDCCPYAVQTPEPVGAEGNEANPTAQQASLAFDVSASDSSEEKLAECPKDYTSISGGCCPSGYALWNQKVGAATPCYSSLSSNKSPPPIPVVVSDADATTESVGLPTGSTPTSAIVNIVYAIQFPVRSQDALSTGAKAGIGVGATLGGIALASLIFGVWWLLRRRKGLAGGTKASSSATSSNPSATPGVMSPTTAPTPMPGPAMQAPPPVPMAQAPTWSTNPPSPPQRHHQPDLYPGRVSPVSAVSADQPPRHEMSAPPPGQPGQPLHAPGPIGYAAATAPGLPQLPEQQPQQYQYPQYQYPGPQALPQMMPQMVPQGYAAPAQQPAGPAAALAAAPWQGGGMGPGPVSSGPGAPGVAGPGAAGTARLGSSVEMQGTVAPVRQELQGQ
ncbi:hypothetical protein BDY21DRAFT_372087 [Lineolata rhizophorae]|uniref:Uncharacterized protein n=1 Tax=Lineolata rhizophorae TaxID=578093 RepID=A0A6A6NZX9_9PEZI|nr:hypothetical protein BDY21DRAFT_372087 [Lineolata rhizophorae]